MTLKYPRFSLLIALVLLLPASVMAQADPSTMGITALQQRASELAEQSQFQTARPYLLEIGNRFKSGTPEEQGTLGPVYFFIGLSYLQEYSQQSNPALLQQAVDAFSDSLKFGVDEQREIAVLEFRGDAYRGLGQFDKAAADYERVATQPLVRIVQGRPAEFREILKKLSMSIHSLREWDRGLPWFLRFLEEASTDQERALAAGLVLEAYIEQNNLEGILELLPLITVDNPSRYSVSLNVALMQAGDKLADKSQYAQAALLYNATLTRDQIVRYFEEREAMQAALIDSMRSRGSSEERLADYLIDLEDTRMQLNAVRQVKPYTSQLMARVARNYYLAGRDYEAVWAYLRFVENYPDDPMAQEFTFAAFITATKLGLDELSRELGEDILAGGSSNEEFRKRVLLSLANAYLDSGDEELFFQSSDDFLSAFPDSPEASQVVFMLGNYLLNKGRLDELHERFALLKSQLKGFEAEDGLYYWPGLAYMFDAQFENAKEEFQVVVNEFPQSVYKEDSAYRLGMTYYGSDQAEKAIADFNQFIADYPKSSLRGEVEFFLGEIAASDGRVLDAIQHYDQVPEYAENLSFITSAYFQKAKLLEKNGALKRAARTYEEYIEEYGEEGQLTQAIFELGEIRKEEGRPGEALTQYQNAILKYGNDPENLGVDPMISTYVEEYGKALNKLTASYSLLERLNTDEEFRVKIASDRGYLYQQFADDTDLDQALYEELRQSSEFSKELQSSAEPIQPYLESYREQLASFPKETPQAIFEREFDEAKRRNKRTMAMRLQMALEELGVPPRNPVVIQEADLERASPKILVWIGENQERIDPEMAKEAYRTAIDFEESVPDKVSAYLNLADMLFEEGDTDGAMALYQEAEDNFPSDPRIYRALIAQARIYSAEGKTGEARERLMQILKTPDWRGEPHAEALYRVGTTYFEEEKYPEAHGFYERTFLGYALFDEWAARAYLMDARTLVEMNQLDDAKRTLNEALSDDRYRETEAYSELVEYANSI